ncbi:MAG: transketolase C-terminal domain-containing protein, partial [Bacteroidales bacterium]|nr:transketolase C-terminal domain-containing protein [Bacteroidales bacterium]
ADFSDINKYEKVESGSDVAIVALGAFFALGENVVRLLKEQGINPTLINPRFITGIDTEMLDDLKRSHRIVVTLEDGALEGGFGEKIARYYGPSDMKVLCYGAKKQFVDRYNIAEFLADNRLVDTMIVEDIIKLL